MLDKFDEGEDDMHAILRTVYYFSKMSCVLFNEHETVWTRDLLVMFSDLTRTVGAYLTREMTGIMNGHRSHYITNHLLEDIMRHGLPSGFSCSPGES